jgi:hypothetical protein
VIPDLKLNKMEAVKLSTSDKAKHIVCWTLITVLLCILDPPAPDKTFSLALIGILLTMLGYIIVYYSHFSLIFPKFYGKNRPKVILLSLCAFATLLLIDYTEVYYISTLTGDKPEFEGAPIYELAAVLLIFFFIIVVMALGAYQNRLTIFKINSQFNNERILLNKSLGFFQNQFNPHITFNFLNYCYGTLLKSSKEGAEAIELFSNMLRHSITNKTGEAIPLAKEIDYISDFIALHKLLNESIQLHLHIIGEIVNQKIMPRILITFIENAIKHGELHSTEYPIQVQMIVDKSSLKMVVKNKTCTKPNFVSSKNGIGQVNGRKHLDLFYKSNYKLVTNDIDGHYFCELTINL